MAKARDAFRTISEVSETLDTPAHVLRFWESKFTQVKPVKRAGGRRYYRPEDVALLGGIKTLLHDQGMTIKAVQKLLRSEGVKHVAALSTPVNPEPIEDAIEHRPAAAASESPAAAPLDNVVPLQPKPRDPPLPDPSPDTPKPPPEPTPPPEPGPPPVAEEDQQAGFDWGDSAAARPEDDAAPVETEDAVSAATTEESDPATPDIASESTEDDHGLRDLPHEADADIAPTSQEDATPPTNEPLAGRDDSADPAPDDAIAERVASRVAEAAPAEPSAEAAPPPPEVAPTVRMAMPPPTPIIDTAPAPEESPQDVATTHLTEADLPSLVTDDPPSPGPRLFDALAAADRDVIRRKSGQIAPILDRLEALQDRMRRPD